MYRTFIFIIFVMFIIGNTIANGVGNEISKTVNGLVFEFGIDPKEPRVNELTTMSLLIHNETTGNLIETNDLWIRISKGDKIFFSSLDLRLKKETPLYMNYIFTESGEYTIDISARYNGRYIMTTFTVDIKDKNVGIKYLLIFIAIFILGYIVWRRFYKKERFKNYR